MKEKLLSKGKKYDNMGMIEVGGGNMKKSKGFTLIELLAVIVILAIIALIATPIILNIINDSKEKSNLRSMDGFGKALEQTVARLMMDSDYTGGNIICEIKNSTTNCYDENDSSISMEVSYSGSRIRNGTIMIDQNTGNVIVSGGQVGSSSNYYSYTTEDGSMVNEVTPDECFNITSDGILTAKDNYVENKACTKDLVIPREVNGIEVKQIGEEAFYELYFLTGVVIPNTVEKIGDYAFYENKLEKVILPDSVNSIGDMAFAYNRLKYIYLSKNLDVIPSESFGYYNVEAGEKIEDIDVYVYIPKGIKAIEWWAFGDNYIREITIPNTIDTIYNGAFYSNPISVIINETGQSFYWDEIIDDLSNDNDYYFVTGTYIKENGNVVVIK